MSKLRVKIWRDLLRMKWRTLAIVMTLGSGLAVYGGLHMGVRSLFWTRDTIYDQLHFADLEVRFIPEDVNNLPVLSDLEGVESVERRLVFPAVIPLAGGEQLMAIMTFLESPTPEIHSFQYLEGRPFRAEEWDGLLIERSLAAYHGYRLGDGLQVKVGEKVYDGRIVGSVTTPEYFISTSNPIYFVPEKGGVGVVFGNLDRVSDAIGYVIVNDLLFRFKPGVNPTAVKRQILDRLSKLNVEEVIPKERHFSYQYIQTELGAIQFFVPAMMIILMALAFIITLVNFGRMVAAGRQEIGALLALGYSRRTLLRSYLEGGLMLGLASGIIGLAGSVLLRDVFARMCADSIGMPEVRLTVDFRILAEEVVMGVVVALVSAAIPVLRLLRLPPQQIIRERRKSWERLRWFTRSWRSGLGRLSMGYRYGFRNLLRQRGRTLATLASIALALGVATAYRMSAASIDETLTRRYERDEWQWAVDFLYPIFLEDLEGLKSIGPVEEIEPYFRRYVSLERDGRMEDSSLMGIHPHSRMSHLPLTDGRGPLPGKDREIVLSLELARKLGVHLGDTLLVHVFNEAYPFRLVGLSSDVMAGFSIIPFSVAQEICQFPEKATGAFLRTNRPFPQLSERLHERAFVGRVVAKTELVSQIRNVISGMVVVLDIASGISIFVAVLFILTSIHLSVLETEGEFATLKAIGYDRSSIARIVFSQTLGYAFGAALLSVPIAMMISIYLNHRMGQAWFRVDNFFSPGEFARVLLPALALIPLGAYPGLRHVFGLDLARTIRTRAIE